ncbi:MAG: hypothetical protein SH847_05505 [Roseiflexaceae bacterium]|nr:hypothetical protein [Roseiflexaceae bacterium]
MSQQKNRFSRRTFLKGTAGIGGGIAMASFTSMFGLKDALAAGSFDNQDSVETMANLAATAETLAATSYYYTILNNPLGFSDAAISYLKLAMSSELYHLKVLQSLGGKSLAQQFYTPANFLSDLAVNTATFTTAETAFTGAYLAATRRFAELGQPRLAATTAQHAATEAEHLALQRLIGGQVPNPNALPAPIFYNVSDAIPVLAPFLQGGSGFVGPVPFPGEDAITALAGDMKAFPTPVFLKVF